MKFLKREIRTIVDASTEKASPNLVGEKCIKVAAENLQIKSELLK